MPPNKAACGGGGGEATAVGNTSSRQDTRVQQVRRPALLVPPFVTIYHGRQGPGRGGQAGGEVGVGTPRRGARCPVDSPGKYVEPALGRAAADRLAARPPPLSASIPFYQWMF